MAKSDEDAAHRSAIQVCFPSGLSPIDTFCQLKSTEVTKEHLHIHVLGMVDLAKVYSRLIHLVGG